MFYFINKDGYIIKYVSFIRDENVEEYRKLYKADKVIYVKDAIADAENYRLVNGELVRLSDEEIQERNTYGKILTADEKAEIEEEKKIALLRPTREEVERAETQLMILDTMEAMNE